MKIKIDEAGNLPAEVKREKSEFQRFVGDFFSRKLVVIGFIGTLFFVLVAIFAPLIATYDPDYIEKGSKLLPASAQHLLGTDMYGRDLFSRLVYGTRVSLLTGVIATLAATFIGSVLGIITAYYGGIVDRILMRACEIFSAIPQIALCLTLITMFGGGMINMAFILCITSVPQTLRMMRASALSIMNSDYILSAKLSGEIPLTVWFKHILPNAVSPIIVLGTQMIGMTIMMESGLSFLGVGIQIPTASWGTIINEARPFLIASPIYVLAPCACLTLLIISINIVGDGIRDALDPSLRGETK